jgi:hypothetical protein
VDHHDQWYGPTWNEPVGHVQEIAATNMPARQSPVGTEEGAQPDDKPDNPERERCGTQD